MFPALFFIGFENVQSEPLPNDASQAELTMVTPE